MCERNCLDSFYITSAAVTINEDHLSRMEGIATLCDKSR